MADATQLNVLLYPYHVLAPLPDIGRPSLRAVETAAALLYFDTVTLGRAGDANELRLPSPQEALEEVDRIAGHSFGPPALAGKSLGCVRERGGRE